MMSSSLSMDSCARRMASGDDSSPAMTAASMTKSSSAMRYRAEVLGLSFSHGAASSSSSSLSLGSGFSSALSLSPLGSGSSPSSESALSSAFPPVSHGLSPGLSSLLLRSLLVSPPSGGCMPSPGIGTSGGGPKSSVISAQMLSSVMG